MILTRFEFRRGLIQIENLDGPNLSCGLFIKESNTDNFACKSGKSVGQGQPPCGWMVVEKPKTKPPMIDVTSVS